MKGMTSKEAKLRRKNMDFSTFNKLSKSPASFKANHARFDIYSEVKSNDTETSKPTAAVSTNTPKSQWNWQLRFRRWDFVWWLELYENVSYT